MSIHMVVSDLHVTFHDKRCLNLVFDTMEKIKPDCVHWLGDWMDCYRISRFLKDPKQRKSSFGKELHTVRDLLDTARQATPRNCEFRISEGNHEDRLRKYVWGQAPELSDLEEITWPSLLKLTPRDKFYKYSEPYKIGNLWYHHGNIIRKWSGVTALAMLQKVGGNVIVGHSHRLAHVYHTQWGGALQAWENGCLCSLRPEYLTGTPDWQQGFSIVTYTGRQFRVDQVHIQKGRMWLNGQDFSTKTRKGKSRR